MTALGPVADFWADFTVSLASVVYFFSAISPTPNSFQLQVNKNMRGRENFAGDDYTLSSTSNSPEVAIRYFHRVEFLMHATGSFSLHSLVASLSPWLNALFFPLNQPKSYTGFPCYPKVKRSYEIFCKPQRCKRRSNYH